MAAHRIFSIRPVTKHVRDAYYTATNDEGQVRDPCSILRFG